MFYYISETSYETYCRCSQAYFIIRTKSIPHRLLTSTNSLPVLRLLALVVPLPSVDDLPLNSKKFSHLLSFVPSIELAFGKRLREKDFLCRREVQVCAFPLPPGVPASTLDTLRRPLLKGFSFTPPPGGPRSTLDGYTNYSRYCSGAGAIIDCDLLRPNFIGLWSLGVRDLFDSGFVLPMHSFLLQ